MTPKVSIDQLSTLDYHKIRFSRSNASPFAAAAPTPQFISHWIYRIYDDADSLSRVFVFLSPSIHNIHAWLLNTKKKNEIYKYFS